MKQFIKQLASALFAPKADKSKASGLFYYVGADGRVYAETTYKNEGLNKRPMERIPRVRIPREMERPSAKRSIRESAWSNLSIQKLISRSVLTQI